MPRVTPSLSKPPDTGAATGSDADWARLDTMLGLLLNLMQADFAATYHRRSGSWARSRYRSSSAEDPPALERLDERWCAGSWTPLPPSAGPERVEKTAADDSFRDLFAARNAFSHRYVFGERDWLAVLYWAGEPPVFGVNTKHALSAWLWLYKDANGVFEEVTRHRDFSGRLAQLLSLFELPIGRRSVAFVLRAMMERFKLVVNHAGVCVLSREGLAGRFTVRESSDDGLGEPRFLKRLTEWGPDNIVADLESAGEDYAWLEVGDRLNSGCASVLATRLAGDEEHIFVVVAWTRRSAGFDDTDRRLLAVGSLLAQAALRISLLIRSLRKVNRSLRKSSSRMAKTESLAALADMTSGVAHDFNNIIGGVVGRLQLMKMRSEDSELRQELGRVEELALEGAETVRRLQEFSMAARYKDPEIVDLCRVIEDSLGDPNASWLVSALKRRVTVASEMSVDSAPVEGFHSDLSTALQELLENAVEHSPEGGRVEVLLDADEHSFRLAVTDHGTGVPRSISQKIFYPFFSTKDTRGSGLGLAIVYGIVSRHNGEVAFEPHADRGTTFTVTLGRCEREEDTEPATGKVKCPEGRLSVLVVDDDRQIREVLQDMLTIEGHSVTSCGDGYTALKALEGAPFDVMITDLGMPGMSGLDLAAVAHETYPRLRIAMITGWGMQLNQEDVVARGIQAVLAKPFHLKEVKGLIESLVEA